MRFGADPSYNALLVSYGDDFRILNPPKPPIWRDPKRMRREASRNFVVAAISVFCAIVSLIPPHGGYREPISFQIARGEPLAWLMFGLIGCAVTAALPTLLRARRFVSAVFCLFVVLGLWSLASSNPRSSLHLSFFIYLAGAILAWTWGLWAALQDSRIFAYAVLATLGAVSCFVSFGIGERLIILSSLATLNTLLLTDLLE
jgi:hypothetical protein